MNSGLVTTRSVYAPRHLPRNLNRPSRRLLMNTNSTKLKLAGVSALTLAIAGVSGVTSADASVAPGAHGALLQAALAPIAVSSPVTEAQPATTDVADVE